MLNQADIDLPTGALGHQGVEEIVVDKTTTFHGLDRLVDERLVSGTGAWKSLQYRGALFSQVETQEPTQFVRREQAE